MLAGVPEALAALAAFAGGGGAFGVRQSVLTGNIRPLAEVKLGALGLGNPLDLAIGAYGDLDEVRAGLVQVARERAAAAAGSGGVGSGDPDEMKNLAIDTTANRELILRQNELLNRLIAREVGDNNGSFLPAELRKR